MHVMKWSVAPLLALLLAGSARSDVSIVGTLTVPTGKLVRLNVEGVKLGDKTRVMWKVRGLPGADGKLVTADLERVGSKLLFTGPAGQYEVFLRVIDFEAEVFDEAEVTVTIGVGPGPGPDPDPGPKPSPAPIPAVGLHVLIVYESADLGKMSAAQQAILYAQSIREYLNTKCPAGPDGKTKEWRIWDKDVATDGESKLWQEAMKRPRSATPWIIVSNLDKGGGFEGPLPTNVADALTLLKKFGGD